MVVKSQFFCQTLFRDMKMTVTRTYIPKSKKSKVPKYEKNNCKISEIHPLVNTISTINLFLSIPVAISMNDRYHSKSIK